MSRFWSDLLDELRRGVGITATHISDAIKGVAAAVRDGLTYIDVRNALYTAPVEAHHSHQLNSELSLTATPTLITDFIETSAPVGFTFDSGVFTAETTGLYSVTVERVYANYDQSPTDAVILTIDFQVNELTVFTRTLPISAATSPLEYGVLGLCTPFLAEIYSGDEISIYVSATDNSLDPADARLISMQITSHCIYSNRS